MTLHIDPVTELDLGDRVQFSPFVYVGCPPLFVKGATQRWKDHPARVAIGEDTKVGSFVTIYRDAVIGKGCLIGTGAIIREGVRIGDGCVIGAGVEVSYEVSIADHVKVMSQSFVVGRTRIGEGSFLGVGVITSNDRHIDPSNYHFSDGDVRGPQIGKHVMVGSGANLLAGITIGDGAIIGSGALVTKDVAAGQVALSKGAVASW